MKRTIRSIPILGVVAVALVLSGCAGSTSTQSNSAPGAAESAAQVSSNVLIDVRTPGEFASGHLEGAVNIPLETSDFAQRVAEVSPGPVDLYCRSGNRSAQAAQLLAQAGIQAVDYGGFEQAQAALGLPVVN